MIDGDRPKRHEHEANLFLLGVARVFQNNRGVIIIGKIMLGTGTIDALDDPPFG